MYVLLALLLVLPARTHEVKNTLHGLKITSGPLGPALSMLTPSGLAPAEPLRRGTSLYVTSLYVSVCLTV